MPFITPSVLESELIKLELLTEQDFDDLYLIASDKLLWEQHPNPDRYKKEVFRNFFNGALENKSSYKLIDKTSYKVIGSSRYYDLNEEKSEIAIGYTFVGREFWGGKYNFAMKHLMLQYAFKFVENVIFHIGACNTRSQIAITRLGANKFEEREIAYYGENKAMNYIYRITKNEYNKLYQF
jgi:RimJ/RimL family protein N-acetyltransferase